jgi:hypothetical protein
MNLKRISLALALSLGGAIAQPIVKDATTSVYAILTDPMSLSFAADGTLYVGRDNSGSGGGSADAVKINRVPPGGGLGSAFGSVAVRDPDVVIADVAGTVSGTAGTVLVGGDSPGVISRITPDGTVSTLFGPSSDYANPSGFAFDLTGRFLFTAYESGRVYAATGGPPTLLFSLVHADYLVADALNRIVINCADETRLRLYTSAGVLSNANFATVKAGTPLARALGGRWGTDIYAVGTGGELLRVDLSGAVTNVGSGFADIRDLRFGPDGALYASDFVNDRIYRFALPDVPGAQTTIYARVTDPIKIAFSPDGTLFAGRDNSGSGGGWVDPVKVHRIASAGTPVVEIGNTTLPDPDAVAFDAHGTISGVPGSVIVGGIWSGSSGYLARIAPDQSVTKFIGPSSAFVNPSDFIFDRAGRLIFSDNDGGKVFVLSNGTPVILFSLSLPLNLTLDALDRIVVSSADNLLRVYSTAGAPVNLALALAQTNSPLACGPGGFWGRDVYFVSTNGCLQCVDTNGVIRTMGSAFGSLDDFAFGPDGALYASHFNNDLIWRIAPSALAAPTLALTADSNACRVSWSGLANMLYQPLTSTNLADSASWVSYGPAIPGTNGPAFFTFPLTTDPAHYFRVLVK